MYTTFVRSESTFCWFFLFSFGHAFCERSWNLKLHFSFKWQPFFSCQMIIIIEYVGLGWLRRTVWPFLCSRSYNLSHFVISEKKRVHCNGWCVFFLLILVVCFHQYLIDFACHGLLQGRQDMNFFSGKGQKAWDAVEKQRKWPIIFCPLFLMFLQIPKEGGTKKIICVKKSYMLVVYNYVFIFTYYEINWWSLSREIVVTPKI